MVLYVNIIIGGSNLIHETINIYYPALINMKLWMSGQNAALSSATQHAMPPEFGRKWGTECLNNRFPLPTLLYAGYSVKLIYYLFNVIFLNVLRNIVETSN